MDPSSISSPSASAPPTNTVPFAAEPNNHPAAPAPPDNPGHPPYAEMIYTAIGALKEQDGSSKRAIAKYIEQVYREHLPPGHDSLLTHHLKRLKSNGMLVMDKKSYKLPGSAPFLPPADPVASPSQASRPRGRPRKALPQPEAQPQAEAQPQNPPPQQNAEPVWAALGLADDPVPVPVQAETPDGTKRGRGRPRKSPVATGVVTAAAQPGPSSTTPRPRGRPPGSKSAKKPGRPKADPAAAAVDPSLPKRGPGRPPKNDQPQATPIPFAALPPEAAPAGEAVAAVPVALTPRGRGRPRKNAYAVVVAGAVPATGAVAGRRGRGRPRGSGRVRGGGLSMHIVRRAGKRPVGRPRKDATAASTSQNVVNEDLRRKLEHFQSKVKESVAVLKPHFNHESPVTAIAAIQELEELGIMDLNAPFRDETLPQQQQHQVPPQEPPQQQQPPPQQQVPLQHVPPQQPAYQQPFLPFHMQQYQQQPPQPFHHP